MQDSKRYYWLKFQKDFFTSKRIKKMRKQPNGDTMLAIYLKIQLNALETDGIITYTEVEDTFAEEVALDIDEDVELVEQTINYLLKYKLLQTNDEREYYLPYVADNTGSETAAAQRGRDYRESMTEEDREKERERARVAMYKSRHPEQGNEPVTNTDFDVTNNVTNSYERVTNNVTECYEQVTNVEKEKEKEKELEKEIYICAKNRTHFAPPSLSEVESYCQERNNDVDPQHFLDYYNSNGWMVGRNKMKDWKAAVRTWEQNGRQNTKRAPATTKSIIDQIKEA